MFDYYSEGHYGSIALDMECKHNVTSDNMQNINLHCKI